MNILDFINSKTSFIILAWNSEKYIESCLRSVLALECARLDVRIIDNGSADCTPDIIAKLAKEDERIHPIYEPMNLGTTVSRNRALNRIPIDTDYVCVLDSDTIVNQHAFEEMVGILNCDSSIGVVGPTMKDASGETQLSGRNFPTLGIKLGKVCPLNAFVSRAEKAEIPRTPIVNNLQDVDYLLSACWLMPKESFDIVGLFDERIFYSPEDVDWCLRCHKAGLRVVRAYEPCIVHEYQRLSHKRIISKTNIEHVRGLAHFFFKHGYLMHAPVVMKKRI